MIFMILLKNIRFLSVSRLSETTSTYKIQKVYNRSSLSRRSREKYLHDLQTFVLGLADVVLSDTTENLKVGSGC